MKKLVLLFFLGSLLFPVLSSAQTVQEMWTARYNGTGNYYDAANAVAVDSNGNVYVTGESKGSSGGQDYVTIKYDTNGNQLWAARYNGTGNGDDKSVAIAVDHAGNVYVTGESKGNGNNPDYATIKYDTNGNQVWVARYNGPANSDDRAHGIALDGSGNVYVTGESKGQNTNLDYATVKYSPGGSQVWVKRYNGPVSYNDSAYAIAVDVNGNIYVTGESKGNGTCLDYTTIKYDTNGNQLWLKRSATSYKYQDSAYAIAVDNSGNVYVTGKSQVSNYYYDFSTIKYDTNGNEKWVQRYNGTGNGDDIANAIAVDSGGNVYVTGESKGNGTDKDYATIKYDTNGNVLWIARYNNSTNNDDIAYAIAVDGNGNVYVTGESEGNTEYEDYATVKYDTNGNVLWTIRYNGTGNKDESARAIAVDDRGNVYVTGRSDGSGSYSDYLTVKCSELKANFSGTPTSGYSPLTVQFTDMSTGTITSRSWTFGDGGTSTQQNPSHTYASSGTYTVSLTVTGPGGSSTETKNSYIHVSGEAAPVANFSGTPTSGYKPLTVTFTDGSTGTITSRSWTFGDGGTSTAQNPSHTYTANGSYTVVLTVTGPGGTDTETKTNFITVTEAPPAAEFSGTPTTGNRPLAVQFTDASTGSITSRSWTFGDGGTSTQQNPSHTYTSTGTFTVALTVTGPGGSDTETKTGYIVVTEAAPVANFSGTPSSGHRPLTVQFTDSSTGNVTSWSWTFGDGGTSTAQNPSHTYTSNGSYTVVLTVTGPGGTDTKTVTNYISVTEAPPAAEFSGDATSGYIPLTVHFTDTSTGNVTSWSWNFGDGGTSTAQNPSHTYSSNGTYTVTLTVTGPGGTDTETKTGYIVVSNAPPLAKFSGNITNGYIPLSVQFTDQSTGHVTGWSWNFGDGGTSSQQNPSHTYNSEGCFSVSLSVTGPDGSDAVTKTNYVCANEPTPVADFSANSTSGSNPLTVMFSDNSTGNIVDWLWDFGDGSTSTDQNPSHSYVSTGDFTVTLTVTGPSGTDSEIKTNYISVRVCGINVPEDYPTIQSAIDASEEGCTIFVSAGTYPENINFHGKALWVKGKGNSANCRCSSEGSHKVAIHGGYNGSVVTFNSGETQNSILEGFTLIYGQAEKGAGVFIDNASPTIRDCFITKNSAFDVVRAEGGGIYVSGSNAAPLIFNNMIVENFARSPGGGSVGGGLYIANGASPTIRNCTVADNLGGYPDGGGAYVTSDSSPQIINSIIWSNSPDDLYCESGCGMDVTYSDIGDPTTGVGNISKDPLFVPGSTGQYYLSHVRAGLDKNSPCIDAGSDSSRQEDLDTRNTATDGVTDRADVDIGYHYVPTPVSIQEVLASKTTFVRGEIATFYIVFRIEGSPKTKYEVTGRVAMSGAFKKSVKKTEKHVPGTYTMLITTTIPAGANSGDVNVTYKTTIKRVNKKPVLGTDTEVGKISVQ